MKISPVIQFPGMAIRVRQEGATLGIEIAGEKIEQQWLGSIREATIDLRAASDDTPIYDVKINGTLILSRPGPRLGLLEPPTQVTLTWPSEAGAKGT